jgi:hypothetical protein
MAYWTPFWEILYRNKYIITQYFKSDDRIYYGDLLGTQEIIRRYITLKQFALFYQTRSHRSGQQRHRGRDPVFAVKYGDVGYRGVGDQTIADDDDIIALSPHDKKLIYRSAVKVFVPVVYVCFYDLEALEIPLGDGVVLYFLYSVVIYNFTSCIGLGSIDYLG